MPRIAYETKNLHDATLDLIHQAIDICEEYNQQGYDLTLRQLYYQFVARGLLPNQQKEYNRLGRAVSEGRMVGLIDWDYITDRTRNLQARQTWGSPAEIVRAASRSYHRERWAGQSTRVEVWVEKEALAGVIGQAADAWFVDYLACRGYMSQSEMWAASQRLLEHLRDDDVEQVVILHLGDHDPSGIDMTRDIADRLFTFMAYDVEHELGYVDFDDALFVDRIALNMAQVQQYNPPPNPAKMSDSRANDYVARYGRQSWELDALDPRTLTTLIDTNVQRYLDQALWDEVVDRENDESNQIMGLASQLGTP